jgi:peptide/nickel transport system substrate-binding protein
VGTVDWCYSDLQDNAFPKMKGVSKNVPLNNLVYLGCNIESGFMSIREIRMGVSVALDRTDLVENAYFGVATPAAGPFPTGLEEADGFQSISPKADKESAEAYFKTAGFTRLGEENYYSNGNDTLTLRLVYNKENTARESVARLVSTRLKTAGCKVTVEPLTFEQYQSAIQHGYYDLYVGEMRLPDNLNLYPLLTAGGLISYPASVLEKEPDLSGETTQGADTSFEVEEDAVDGFTALRAAYRYQKGEGSLTETLSCINDQLPIIPICHRQGMLIYASFISGEPTPTHGDPFHGIENCTIQ